MPEINDSGNSYDDHLKIILKGIPGTRKSTQAATFVEAGDVFWFDIDRKLKATLALPRKLGLIPRSNRIVYEQYESWYKIEKQLEAFQSRCDYRTVVLDSVTSIGDRVNRQTLKDKDGKGKKIGGISVNTIEDYNAENSALMYMIDLAKLIEAHVIVIGHVIHRDNSGPTNPGAKPTRQLVTGGKVVGAKLPAYFPEVYHFEFDHAFDPNLPPNYIMYTQMHGEDFARTGLPLPYKVELTKGNLYRIIKDAQSELQDSTTEQLEQSKSDNNW